MANDNKVIEVTQKELAEIFGVSQRRVRQMPAEGIVIRTQSGKYDLVESAKNYIQMVKNRNNMEEDDDPKRPTPEKVKLARELEGLQTDKLRKRKIELSVNTLENKLHDADNVRYVWNTMATAIKTRVSAIPRKAAPKIVGIEDMREAEELLEKEVNEALSEIANYKVSNFVDRPSEEEHE